MASKNSEKDHAGKAEEKETAPAEKHGKSIDYAKVQEQLKKGKKASLEGWEGKWLEEEEGVVYQAIGENRRDIYQPTEEERQSDKWQIK